MPRVGGRIGHDARHVMIGRRAIVNFLCVSVHSISGTRVCDSQELKRLRKRLQTRKAPRQDLGATPDAKFPVLLVTKHPCCSVLPCQVFPHVATPERRGVRICPTNGRLAPGLSYRDLDGCLRAASEASVAGWLIARDEQFTET